MWCGFFRVRGRISISQPEQFRQRKQEIKALKRMQQFIP